MSDSWFGWDLWEFVESRGLSDPQDAEAALQLLAVEYDEDNGVNESFSSVIRGTYIVLGNVSETRQKLHNSLGLGAVPLGGTVGGIDCHIGGVPGSCGERAALIEYDGKDYCLSCLSSNDLVTVNGQQVLPHSGSIPLYSLDVCSVGARVFCFL